MNQQMNLLEARAVARERERQLIPRPRAPRRQRAVRRPFQLLVERRAGRQAGSRPRHALAARG